LAEYKAAIHKIDAISIAAKLNNIRTVNIAMLGFCAAVLGLKKEVFASAIKKSVDGATLEVNLRAFEGGFTIFSL